MWRGIRIFPSRVMRVENYCPMPKTFMERLLLQMLCTLPIMLLALSGCNSTKYLKSNEYLLSDNEIFLSSSHDLKNKGEIKDNLTRLLQQKPNAKSWVLQSPVKLWLYNYKHQKFAGRPDSLLPKYVEKPVIFDSSLVTKSEQSIKNYLFNLGYFYVKMKDTVLLKGQKAYVKHYITLGDYYEINSVSFTVPDSAISKILNDGKKESALQKDNEYTIASIDEERSRIVTMVRNAGYFHFTQDNIGTFSLDTFDKSLFRDATSAFEGVVNFINKSQSHKNPTVDVEIVIKKGEDSESFSRYTVGSVNVFPDFHNYSDFKDSTLIRKTMNGVNFFYHDYFVHDRILYEHIFVTPGKPYSQKDQDKTFVKLNELGIFQYIKIVYTENPEHPHTLDCNIYMNKSKKFDFSQNDELSSGTTYDLGLSAGVNFHNRNFEKGANLFTLSLNGGIEYAYQPTYGNDFINHFLILTEYAGINGSIDFPKFISPVGKGIFDNDNLPHTILSGGINEINRLNYFRLINTSSNYNYSWHKSRTVSWTLSPVFINIISMPYETDSFRTHLDEFPFLKNSYKPNFIEGENLTFTYSDAEKKHSKNYSYLRLGFEEAGTILGLLNQVGVTLNDLFKIQYAQYVKFDFDARHFFTLRHSSFAFRFYGGVGVPYGQSEALPYIKQYFVGGPYSIRGWQIRSLGPGKYYDSTNTNGSTIDRTGDIKLEANGEYRFPIAPLFAGAIKMNGALFADAGNIWLAKSDPSFPGGNFQLNTLGSSIAADVGAGARFDIATFLTFRLDVAMPVKRPNLTANGGWTFSDIAFSDPGWRNNNLVLNIAIGYPF